MSARLSYVPQKPGVKPHDNGYCNSVSSHPFVDAPPTGGVQVQQALRTVAAVAGVVVLVLALLILAVYAVVFVDLMPQMQ